MIKKFASMLLSLCLLVGALSFVSCTEDAVKRIKQGVASAKVVVDEGQSIVDEYESQNILTADQAKAARTSLNTLNTAIDAFTKYGASIKKVDWKSKQDLLELFAAVTKGANDFVSKAGPTIIAALEVLNAAEVLKVENPKQLVSRVSAVLHGLSIAIGLVKSRLENLDVQDEPQTEVPQARLPYSLTPHFALG